MPKETYHTPIICQKRPMMYQSYVKRDLFYIKRDQDYNPKRPTNTSMPESGALVLRGSVADIRAGDWVRESVQMMRKMMCIGMPAGHSLITWNRTSAARDLVSSRSLAMCASVTPLASSAFCPAGKLLRLCGLSESLRSACRPWMEKRRPTWSSWLGTPR